MDKTFYAGARKKQLDRPHPWKRINSHMLNLTLDNDGTSNKIYAF